MSRTAVYGILHNRNHLEALVDSLCQVGFRNKDISLLLAPIANEEAAASRSRASKWPVGVTALASPGVGPLIGAGPIMHSFNVARSLLRTLTGIGIADHHARCYEQRIKSGDLLFSVHCSNRLGAQRAKTVLEQSGAEEIDLV
jgi:hypothetical protein